MVIRIVPRFKQLACFTLSSHWQIIIQPLSDWSLKLLWFWFSDTVLVFVALIKKELAGIENVRNKAVDIGIGNHKGQK